MRKDFFSKIAYSFFTVSPLNALGTILGLYFAIISLSGDMVSLQRLCNTWATRDVILVIVLPIAITAVVWMIFAWKRWIPARVTIPKSKKINIDARLNGCVQLCSDSIFNVEGCPVLAYNTNNFTGGCMISENGYSIPNLMAQFMHKAFNSGDSSPLSFEQDLFLKCYYDKHTHLFAPTMQGTKHIEELDKSKYRAPHSFSQSDTIPAEDGAKEKLPLGAVLALRLPDSAQSDYAFFLCSTYLEEGSVHPKSNLHILEKSLNTLWKAADEVLKGDVSHHLSLPLLGSGNSNMKEGKYSSIWTIVSTYRMAHLEYTPICTMSLCIPPSVISELDLREVLKMMTYALCG